MMAKVPFMQFYPGDYLADTQHLTTEQHGAYLLILMAMWTQGGALPNDEKKLARIAGVATRRWHVVGPDVVDLLTVEGDQITQKRLQRERQKADSKSEKRSVSGAKGGRSKSLKNKEPALANASGLPPPLPKHSPEPDTIKDNGQCKLHLRDSPQGEKINHGCPKPRRAVPYTLAFEQFWKNYPTDANMSKKEAFAAWRKLAPEDQELAQDAIPGFLEFCSNDPTYRPVHACRFITQRRFDGFAEGAESDLEELRKRLRA